MTEQRTGLSRRGFLASSAAAAGALALGAGTNSAQAADTLKVGFISPRTGGPMAMSATPRAMFSITWCCAAITTWSVTKRRNASSPYWLLSRWI